MDDLFLTPFPPKKKRNLSFYSFKFLPKEKKKNLPSQNPDFLDTLVKLLSHLEHTFFTDYSLLQNPHIIDFALSSSCFLPSPSIWQTSPNQKVNPDRISETDIDKKPRVGL